MIYIAYFINIFCLLYLIFETYKFKGFSFFKKNNYSSFFDSVLSTSILLIIFNNTFSIKEEDKIFNNEIIIYTSLLLLMFTLNKIYHLYSCIKITNKIEPKNGIEQLNKYLLKNLFLFFSKNKIIKSINSIYSNEYIKYYNESYTIITNIYYEENNFFTLSNDLNYNFNIKEINKIFQFVEFNKLNLLLLIDNKDKSFTFLNEKDIEMLNIKSLNDINKNSISLLNIIKL